MSKARELRRLLSKQSVFVRTRRGFMGKKPGTTSRFIYFKDRGSSVVLCLLKKNKVYRVELDYIRLLGLDEERF
jgi:hypothetical protein